MDSIDFDAIKRQIDIAAVIGEYVDLKRVGREYVGLCPFHKERNPSFSVVPDKGFYNCFSCGEHGDIFDFLQKTRGVSMREAAEMLGAGRASPPDNYRKQAAEKPPVKRLTIIPPSAKRVDEPPQVKSCRQPDGSYLDVNRARFWKYTNAEGDLAFFVCRFESGVGEKRRKETPQWTYGSNDGGNTWRWWWGHFNEPRPLYNLKAVAENVGKPVLIVEGEKAADAAMRLMPQYVVTTWAGGTNAVDKSDWSALEGRKILIWPDNDDPGKKAAEEIALLIPAPAEIKILTPGEALEKGFDAADALENGWDNKMTISWARQWHKVWSDPRRNEEPDAQPDTEQRPVLRVLDGGKSEQPAAEDPECYSWGAPADPFKTMRAPAWNKDHFPEVIATWADDAGKRCGVDPGSVAMMCLVACASVISDDIQIAVKRNDTAWRESARLWVMMIGDPSLKKSPAMRPATNPIKTIDAKMRSDYLAAINRYNKDMEDWAIQKKNAGRIGGMVPDPPVKPEWVRTWIDDITAEKLAEVLSHSPRGVLGIQDELSSWLGGMDAYRGKSGTGASKDAGFYLKCYNGDSAIIDRVSKETIVINRLSLSMIGLIQPGVFRKMRLTEDGLLQRFIPIMAQRAAEGDISVDTEAQKAYGKLVYRLFQIAPAYDHTLIRLTPEAQVHREAAFERIRDLEEFSKQVSDPMASAFGKYTGMWARLCLTIHCIECATDGKHPQSVPVSESVAIKTNRLLLDYLRPHLMVFYLSTQQSGGSVADHVRWIAGYILARKERLLTNRNVMRAYKQWFKCDWHEQQRSYEMLEALDWIRPIKEKASDNVRPSRFVVNPAVFPMFEEQAKRELTARKRIREYMADLMTGEPKYSDDSKDDADEA